VADFTDLSIPPSVLSLSGLMLLFFTPLGLTHAPPNISYHHSLTLTICSLPLDPFPLFSLFPSFVFTSLPVSPRVGVLLAPI